MTSCHAQSIGPDSVSSAITPPPPTTPSAGHAAPGLHPTAATSNDRPTITILGGAPDSGNLGVAALGTCAVKGTLMAFPRARIILQSWRQANHVDVFVGDRIQPVESMMIYHSTKLLARHGTRHLGIAGRCLAPWPRLLTTPLSLTNRTLAQLMASDVILDASGGDAFSEIYGNRMFLAQAAMKLLAKQLRKPLLLLPQTFGPFRSPRGLELFREIADYATLLATREADGIGELGYLCGDAIKGRVVRTPDMAFILDPVEVTPEREPATSRAADDRVIIGLNVSGLLYLSPSDFGLKFPYPELVDAVLQLLLNNSNTRIVLVPHVLQGATIKSRQRSPSRDHSDLKALQAARDRLSLTYRSRVTCLKGDYSAGETKFLIGQCDFFIGARMHACIAAVSQCVPTATIAYSKKASQLMINLGIGETVIEPRLNTLEQCAATIGDLYDQRYETAAKLNQIIPPVKQSVESFFRETLRQAVLRVSHAEHC